MSLTKFGDFRWWAEDLESSTRAQRIQTVASRLWEQHAGDRDLMWRMARLYGGPMTGLFPQSYRNRLVTGGQDALSLNVVKAVSDTFVSILTKDRPKAIFQPSGADYATQKRAFLLEKFCDGVSYEAGLYEIAPNLVLDTCIFGHAVVKASADISDPKRPKIVLDRVYPWEVLVSDAEAYYGGKHVKNYYQIHTVDRLVLSNEYPELEEQIRTAGSNGFTDLTGSFDNELEDRVVVVEAWHLPANRSSKDGRHTTVVGNVVLEDEPWTRETSPFEFLYRLEPRMGMVGLSLAYELKGLQLQINELLNTLRRALHLLGTGHWIVQAGQVLTSQIDNYIGSVIKHKGVPPVFENPTPVSPQVFQHLIWCYQIAFESIGVSQQAAQSQKPPGLNSGKALLVYADVQSQRFQPCYRAYQHFFMRIARQEIALAREISETCKGYTIKTEINRSVFSATTWADAQMDDDEFVLKMKPGNALADDPAALAEMLQGMTGGGMIPPSDAARMFADNVPDLESYFKDVNASYDLTKTMIETLLSGKYVSPEPEMNLTESIKLVATAYLRAKMANPPEPEKTLQLFRSWLSNAQAMVAPPPPPQGPPMPTPPEPPAHQPPPSAPSVPNAAPKMAA